MSDRKYRQRGYQDSGSRPEPRRDAPKPTAPADRQGEPRGRVREPRAPNMPGFRSVVKCSRCGQVVTNDVGFLTQCGRCGTDLHTCAMCESFDTSAPFECTQTIPVRISPKDARNTCSFYEARVVVERETTTPKVHDARSAFDDLFK
jgi:hypothetical protein